MAQLLIFTDLDGTFLDHETYEYEAAKPALALIAKHNVPLIFATSKTAAEIAALVSDLELSWPAIVENGAGIWRPGADSRIDVAIDQEAGKGIAYDDILAILDELPSALRSKFYGFSQLSVEEISKLTGLPANAARRAKARDWSEPGHWLGDDDEFEEFRRTLSIEGLGVIKGGRFVHVLGKTSKAKQMAVIRQEFAAQPGVTDITTAALGDAPNDIEMLEAADFGFVIANPSGTPLPELKGESAGKIRRVALPGPLGWNRAVLDLIDELGLS